jgi:hypothetical protein
MPISYFIKRTLDREPFIVLTYALIGFGAILPFTVLPIRRALGDDGAVKMCA